MVDMLRRTPITGIAGCCARAASGHAAAPPKKRDELTPLHVRPQAQETASYRLKLVL